MSRGVAFCGAAALAVIAVAVPRLHADRRDRALVVTMTNEASANQIKVYDAETRALIQTLPTHGKGGVSGNARGVKQFDGEVVAAVNNGSNTVAIFRREGFGLRFDKLVTTTSAPVSIDFGNDHLYVAGATTIDSFIMHRDEVRWMDGTTSLELAEGGVPPIGSTAQVGVLNHKQLLVTLKTDPVPGTVDVIALRDGAVTATAPKAVAAPAGTLTPFGFSVYRDGSALITLAHSAHDGLFRDGAFQTTVGAGQLGPCWTTRVGKYIFTANTGSGTISRLVGTGTNVFIDAMAAARVTTGGAPVDIDADGGVLAVIDHGAGQSHLSLFTYNQFGELAPIGSAINLATRDANGVAVMAPRDAFRF
jgi:hypothetical protein